MHFTPAVVMAARFTNETAPATDPAAGFPARVGPFALYGCVADQSTTGFKMVGSNEAMNVDLCAASCPSDFMGMSGTDCFCGDALDEAMAPKVGMEECTSSTMMRRIVDDNDDNALNVMTYKRQETNTNINDASSVTPNDSDLNGIGNGNGDGDGNGNGNGIGNKGNGIGNVFDNQVNNNYEIHNYVTPAPTTVTEIITSTHTGTITTCAPEFPDCPHSTTTDVVVITTTYCPEPTPYCPYDHCEDEVIVGEEIIEKENIDYEWYNKKMTCYGGYCAPEYPCDDCEPRRVVCDENDSCWPEMSENEDDHNRVIVCTGDDCKYDDCYGEECGRKVVCYSDVCAPEECYGDECNNKYVCYDDIECGHESCNGDDCYTRENCYDGVCDIVEPCNGADCPVPAPPANIPVAVGPPTPSNAGCPGTGCDAGYPSTGAGCSGAGCDAASSSNGVACTGADCVAGPSSNGVACTGADCGADSSANGAACTGVDCGAGSSANGAGCSGAGCDTGYTGTGTGAESCTGAGCPAGGDGHNFVPIGASAKALPAVGITLLGAVAGFAFML